MLTSRPRLPRAAIAAFALAIALLSAAPALAQYPLTSGTLAVGGGGSPSAPVPPGAVVALAGGGFAPGAEVQIWLFSDPVQLATVSASDAGAIDVRVEIPAGTPGGRHTLEARGSAPGGGTVVLRAPVVVAQTAADDGDETDGVGAEQGQGSGSGSGSESASASAADAQPTTTTADGGSLPFTGLPLVLVALAGAALLLAGGLLAVLARRRRTI
jgi:hypothetical protein